MRRTYLATGNVPNRRSVMANITLSTRNRPNLIFRVFFARRSQNGALPGAQAALLKQFKKILFSSTCATYGLNPSSPMSEDAEQDPCSPYARTKLAVEWMIRDFAHTYGIGFTILRYFNAAGASEDGRFGEYHHPETHLIPLVLEDILKGPKALKVFGDDYPTVDGTCIRDYVHIEDIIEVYKLLSEKLYLNPKKYRGEI